MERIALYAFVAGSAWVQTLAALPGYAAAGAWVLGMGAWVALALRLTLRMARCFVTMLAAGWLGIGSASLHAHYRLADALDRDRHDTMARLEVRVSSLPQCAVQRCSFTVQIVGQRPTGVPTRLAVIWRYPEGEEPPVLPGQRWRMLLLLRQLHRPLNPYKSDAEVKLLAQRVRAAGTVRGKPVLLADEPWVDAVTVLQRIRACIRDGMRTALGTARFASVLIALALGDQAGIRREDWTVFNRTGITHLVAISGLHITLVAGLCGATAGALWRRGRWHGVGFAERIPALVVAAIVTLFVAWLYCLLAGWGIPAQRSFFMLGVAALAAVCRLPLSPGCLLAWAAVVVTAFDPWAPVAAGFWLSFAAVAILLQVSAGQWRQEKSPQRWVAMQRSLLVSARLQLSITGAITPILAFLVQQVSLSAPLANALAIPAISMLVTPLALLCALFSVVPGAMPLAAALGGAGHTVFALVMIPITWLSQTDWASIGVAATPWPWLLFALLGVMWAIQPTGWPARACGWLLLLPALCWRPERPAQGEWVLTALEVGQGSAVVIETAAHVLLFDTGPGDGDGADTGARIVVPFLHARGYRALDVLVLTRADLSHAGGLRSLLQALPVHTSYTSFDVSAYLEREARARDDPALRPLQLPAKQHRCDGGLSWWEDGVHFTLVPFPALGPGDPIVRPACVLKVEGKFHTALLLGDLRSSRESTLAPYLPVDVVVMARNGSASASSAAFVQAAAAKHAIAQVGCMNPFHHPAPRVCRRWLNVGTIVWRTDRDGAVTITSYAERLQAQAQRQDRRRYWHNDNACRRP